MDIGSKILTVAATHVEHVTTPLHGTTAADRQVTAVEEEWAAALRAGSWAGSGRLLYCLAVKRWIDITMATLLLIACSPLMVGVTALIYLDSRGPIFFRQVRVGLNGRPFVVYKFRSMDPASIAWPATLTGSDGRVPHKMRNDPRVTRVGRFLRRTSLDELPQLINVVRGEMSLVGPRPELPQIVSEYAPWQHQRHLVRPGITGWWQIRGRSELPMHEHTELDIHYVEHISFRLDLYILWRTLGVVFSGHGAF